VRKAPSRTTARASGGSPGWMPRPSTSRAGMVRKEAKGRRAGKGRRAAIIPGAGRYTGSRAAKDGTGTKGAGGRGPGAGILVEVAEREGLDREKEEEGARGGLHGGKAEGAAEREGGNGEGEEEEQEEEDAAAGEVTGEGMEAGWAAECGVEERVRGVAEAHT